MEEDSTRKSGLFHTFKDSWNEDEDDEAPLRAHIRSLLLDYCMTHLTVDYVEWTERVVSEFHASLRPISLYDPASLTIPPDPWDIFSKSHKLHELIPYEEQIEVSQETITFIKKALFIPKGTVKSERAALLSTEDETYGLPWFPEPPVLSRRARKQTPRLGRDKPIETTPKMPRRLADIDLSAVPRDFVSREKIDRDDTLDVNLTLSSAEIKEVSGLLQSVRGDPKHKNSFLDPCYLPPILQPTPQSQFEELIFKPIFPRSRRPQTGVPPKGKKVLDVKLNTILSHVNPVMDDPEEDELYIKNLKIVDGWTTLSSSPVNSQTTSDSGKDQSDQLETPDTSPAALNMKALNSPLGKAKKSVTFALGPMEMPLIPRKNRPGGSVTKRTPRLGEGQRLGSFLSPVLSTLPTPQSDNTDTDRPAADDMDEKESLRCHAPNSTLDPGSFAGDEDNEDELLHSLFSTAGIRRGDPREFIMKEMLDAVDGDEGIMEVPILPPPNLHKQREDELVVPKSFSELRSDLGDNTQNDRTPRKLNLLQKAKGLQSLTVSLSWMPFSISQNECLPSHEDVSDVVDLFSKLCFDERLPSKQLKEKYQALLMFVQDDLDSDGLVGTAERKERERYTDFDETRVAETGSKAPVGDLFGTGIMLSRRERMRRDGDGFRNGNDEVHADMIPSEQLGIPRAGKKRSHSRAYVPEDDGEDLGLASSSSPNLFRAKRLRRSLDSDCYQERSATDFHPDDTIMTRTIPSQDDVNRFAFLESYSPAGEYGVEADDKENVPLQLEVESPPLRTVLGDRPDEEGYATVESEGEDVFPSSLSLTTTENNPGGPEQPDLEQDIFYPLSFPISLDSQDPGLGNPRSRQEISMSNFAGDSPMASFCLPGLDPNASCSLPGSSHSYDDNVADALLASESLTDSFIAAQSLGVDHFAQLRASIIERPSPLPSEPCVTSLSNACTNRPQNLESSTPPQTVSTDLHDSNTFQLPQNACQPSSEHRYLASLSLIQKQNLVRALRSRSTLIELVERDELGGVDLILDPYTAIILVNLFPLPSKVNTITADLARLSWSYTHVLVVFESYPESKLYNSRRHPQLSVEDGLAPYAYTPPIVKAIRKLRRDISIAEGCGTKRASTRINWAFAGSVDETALLVRAYGDMVEDADRREGTGGLLWNDGREWLEGDVPEDEGDLSVLPGMNRFAAYVMLSQVDGQGLIDMLDEERIRVFGGLVGTERVNILNKVLAERREVVLDADDGSGLS